MKYSRRELGLLLPSLLAAQAAPTNNDVERLPVMKTERLGFEELPVTTNGKNKQRRMFTAKTHTGFKIESHQSDIAPGEVNHPPHQHLREEMMLIREGVMELTIAGKPYRLGAGDVGVIGSNEIHNAKNVGTSVARYFIVNIGRDDV
jgi:XRE family transcriptional regulator, regulator of sulfur utilization